VASEIEGVAEVARPICEALFKDAARIAATPGVSQKRVARGTSYSWTHSPTDTRFVLTVGSPFWRLEIREGRWRTAGFETAEDRSFHLVEWLFKDGAVLARKGDYIAYSKPWQPIIQADGLHEAFHWSGLMPFPMVMTEDYDSVGWEKAAYEVRSVQVKLTGFDIEAACDQPGLFKGKQRASLAEIVRTPPTYGKWTMIPLARFLLHPFEYHMVRNASE
jgi:hypothetical protein